MSVEQEIAQAVRTAIRDSVFLTLESGEDVFQLHTRAALGGLRPFIDELERFRKHSITLNTIGWKLAVALGDVPEGADQTTGNPIEQAERLIGQRDDALLALADLTPPQRDRERAVLDAAANVVRVWRLWETGRGQAGEPIPVRKLADAVDVLALGPAADALSEPPLPRCPHCLQPAEPGHEDRCQP